MNSIELHGLTKSYASFTLGPIDLCLPEGTIMGLVGENGAGKSTLINLIMNSVPRDGGSVSVLGTDSMSAAFSSVKEEIGVVLDEACFPNALCAAEIGKIMKCTYKSWDSETYRSLLERFSLSEKKRFGSYSRGMKMKLGIAAALSHKPRLLILDEATSGLDPMIRDEILDIFSDFTRDERCSVLLSSHIVSDLEKICDYIAFLHRGRLVLCEEKDRLREEYALVHLSERDAYSLPAGCAVGTRRGAYGTEVLARRELLPPSVRAEYTSLEDIILFLAREDNAK